MSDTTSNHLVLLLAASISRRLPAWAAASVIALALNARFVRHLDQDVSATIRRKIIRIVVRDADFSAALFFDGNNFLPALASSVADVTITASARDFLSLATREEDPDTLFFARRLMIEGDTEAGLTLKNALDALATETILSPLMPPLHVLRQLRSLLPRMRS